MGLQMYPLLPFHPHPTERQKVTSWIFDVAFGNGVSGSMLLHHLGLQRCDVIGMVKPSDRVITTLSEATATPGQDVINTFPSSFAAIYDVSHHTFSYSRRRAWHLHTGPSVYAVGQYCPGCLLEFGDHQVTWNFALFHFFAHFTIAGLRKGVNAARRYAILRTPTTFRPLDVLIARPATAGHAIAPLSKIGNRRMQCRRNWG